MVKLCELVFYLTIFDHFMKKNYNFYNCLQFLNFSFNFSQFRFFDIFDNFLPIFNFGHINKDNSSDL